MTTHGPVGWEKIAEADPVTDPAVEPRQQEPLTEDDYKDLMASASTMQNLKVTIQTPGWAFIQSMMVANLNKLRKLLEESDNKDGNDIYLKAGIRCYKEFLQIVPQYIATGELDAQRLKEDMERG